MALLLPEPLPKNTPLRLEPQNLSLNGMKFLSNQKSPLFSMLEVQFFHAESGAVLTKAKGKVVRLEEIDTGLPEKIYGIALTFSETLTALEPLLSTALPETTE